MIADTAQPAPQPQTDLLGQSGNESLVADSTDKSRRELLAIAEIRQAVTKRGGQPQ